MPLTSLARKPPVPVPAIRHPQRPYVKLRKIGQGSFGSVYLVRSSQGATLVMKTVSLHGLPVKEQRAAMNEVRVLQARRHDHLIKYHDSYVTRAPDSKLCIVLEWASGGDLAALIHNRRKAGNRFSEPEILRMLYQMCSALAYCQCAADRHSNRGGCARCDMN